MMEPESLKYLLSPVICAFIGWMTNYLAIRMLFHPRQPVHILGWTWQGLFPKRQAELAWRLGELVETELLNHQDIREIIDRPEFQTRLRSMVQDSVHRFVQRKLTSLHPLLNTLLRGAVAHRAAEMIVDEVERFLPGLVEQAASELESQVQVQRIVREKIEAFSPARLEGLLFSMLRKEFWFIEIIGGVLGLVVGSAQALIFVLW
ncbi:DUF445 domain-containing protein [Desulfovermiculus halophilus]|uniref:DUF445 domain-containing protein n=1 Tax=Desulfovermiculus halophilus TaxID=339722 RepID=UPI0004808999|nr:DUF445 family protein [Desulfovermiculus halophilus]